MSLTRQPLILLTVIFLLMLPVVPVQAAEADSLLTVSIDDETVEYQASTIKSLVFLAAQDITESLGGTVEYDATKKSLTITYEKTKAVLDIGSSNVLVNDEKVSLDAAPMLLGDVAVIPAKAVPAIWGVSVGWNEQDLYIRTDGEEVVVPEVAKVVVEKAVLTVNEKETNVSYITIPADTKLKADVVIAQNCIGKTETLENLAQRNYAKAAVNANYFQSYDPSKPMEPYGLIIKNGYLVHGENTGGTIAFLNDGTVDIGLVKSEIKADLNGVSAEIAMLNHTPAKDANQIVLFNNFHGKEMGFAYGINVIVQNGVVTGIEQNKNTVIPDDGYVLNFTGTQEKLAKALNNDNLISYQVEYVNDANEKLDWTEVHTAIGAGPILLADGEVVINPEKEGFVDLTGFSLATARSAVGYTADNNLILVAGVKCTLDELAIIMGQLGAVDALALDAGSVSGSYVQGEYLATPSKEISTALIFR